MYYAIALCKCLNLAKLSLSGQILQKIIIFFVLQFVHSFIIIFFNQDLMKSKTKLVRNFLDLVFVSPCISGKSNNLFKILDLQGCSQRMRLQRRLYGIYTNGFLIFMTSYKLLSFFATSVNKPFKTTFRDKIFLTWNPHI